MAVDVAPWFNSGKGYTNMNKSVCAAEEPEILLADRRTKVWLECNGEPWDFRSVKVSGVRTIADDVQLVVFTCPRCGNRHQSLRFI